MINMNELFQASLAFTSEKHCASQPFDVTVAQCASVLVQAAAAAATSVAASVPESSLDKAVIASATGLGQASSTVAPVLSSLLPSTPPMLTLSSFPYPSFLAHFFSRHEPLEVFNFDLNPNTSVFMLTFLGAMMVQILGFYTFRYFVPRLKEQGHKNQRALSWVLTLFSSIILFTGTFTLSSQMEWGPMRDSQTMVLQPESPISPSPSSSTTTTLLSLQRFPQESDLATMYAAYFVSYLICDLVLGVVYYRPFLDPLSGWAHHLGYLGVVSNAFFQKNVSTFFAMGTPIEVSTIFLSSGHIFPELRSDLLFATSFFISRIVYPIVLLPELYWNVDSRLCWKVGFVALVVHIHWFRKFVKQQVRYYRQRHVVTTVSLQDSEKVTIEEATKIKADSKTPVATTTTTTTTITTATSEKVKSLEITVPDYFAGITAKDEMSPETGKVNSMFEMGLAIMNEMQENQDRHRSLKKGSTTSRVSSRVSSRTPSFEHDIVTPPYEQLNDSEADTDADSDEAWSSVIRANVAAQQENHPPAKTMQQLLEESDHDDFTSYAKAFEGGVGKNSSITNNNISNNKTFSALALKKLMSSQGSGAVRGGAVRLSRPSSIRDTKRRIGLDSIRFEDHSSLGLNTTMSVTACTPQPQELMPTMMEEEGSLIRTSGSVLLISPVLTEEKEEEEEGEEEEVGDTDATVVFRKRPSRASVLTSQPSGDNVMQSGRVFGTMRVRRGMAMQF